MMKARAAPRPCRGRTTSRRCRQRSKRVGRSKAVPGAHDRVQRDRGHQPRGEEPIRPRQRRGTELHRRQATGGELLRFSDTDDLTRVEHRRRRCHARCFGSFRITRMGNHGLRSVASRSPWLQQLDNDAEPRPLADDRSTDVVIIGAGIAGVATVFFTLRSTSKRVLLIERHRVGRGATGHNAGQLATYFERPFCDLVDAYGFEPAIEGNAGSTAPRSARHHHHRGGRHGANRTVHRQHGHVLA